MSNQADTGVSFMATTTLADAQQILQQKFGLCEFRAGQSAVIAALLSGRPAAAVFPTGGGKSLCYQLPSQLLPGTTLVVSPLIALMKDQCDALAQRGIAAARLDSTQSAADFQVISEQVRSGQTKLLYVAPERLFNERFRVYLDSLRIDLFAIDEAHCISQWGHNFRPDYLKLSEVARSLGVRRVLALTATATPEVLDDIRNAFQIAATDVVQTPFFRPHLKLRSTVLTAHRRDELLLSRLQQRPSGPTLIYVSLQKTAEHVAEWLQAEGFSTKAYHAGLETAEREEIQHWFLGSKDGIVVATIAFGMGIDKPDIRYVYHYNPPKSLEAYAQEVGRAARDGKDALCEMLLVPSDRVVLENFSYGNTPSQEAIERLLTILAGQPDTFFISHYRTAAETDIRMLVVRTLLTYLELDDYLHATSPRYETYKFKPLVSSQRILQAFTGERRQFVSGILACSVKRRKWFELPLAIVEKRLRSDRQRILKAIDFLAQQSWIEVEVSDLVHGYRKGTRKIDPQATAAEFYQRLLQREKAEIRRLHDVLKMAAGRACMAATLSAHFGETLPRACGHCTACRGEGAGDVNLDEVPRVGRSATDAVLAAARAFPELLDTPRARARFLCGLGSPQFTAKRITRHPQFGACNEVPFGDVLQAMQRLTPTSGERQS